MSEVAEEEEVSTEVTEEEETVQSNPLEMSDEEFEKQELPEDPVAVVEEEEEEVEEEDKEENEEEEDADESIDTASTDTSNTDDSNDNVVSQGEPTGQETEKTAERADKSASKEKTDGELWKELITPIKANGKQMVIDNVEDARRLISMGMGYSKKMEALKPNLKIIKMLENNKLLDESKISYLIDLSKKDSKAVHKLIKDSGIDPHDVDTEEGKEVDYQPGNYSVQDQEVELDTVLDEIRDSPSYAETIDIVGSKWDVKSRQVLLEKPQIITVINEHVAAGIYGQITSVVEREKMMGRLAGLSDLEAYKQVGDAIQAEGGFDDHASNNQPSTTVQTKPKATASSQSPKVKAQKRAVAAPKAVASKPTDFKGNPLNMTDDEFEKMAGLDF